MENFSEFQIRMLFPISGGEAGYILVRLHGVPIKYTENDFEVYNTFSLCWDWTYTKCIIKTVGLLVFVCIIRVCIIGNYRNNICFEFKFSEKIFTTWALYISKREVSINPSTKSYFFWVFKYFMILL